MSFILKHKKTSILIVIIAALLIYASIYKIAPVSWGIWGNVNAESGVALKGYDAVSYHKGNAAVKGSPSNYIHWKNVDWYFSSDKNKELFKSNPERYAPQYGGYCALGVSRGVTADANPEYWHIHNGKLYMFYNDDPKQDWISEIDDGVIESGDKNWGDF